CAGLIVTRHSAGKLPTLIHLDPDIHVLNSCVEKLAPQHLDELSSLFPSLWLKHKGNLRHILLECYDSIR
ncbi:MAG: hypothetical protein AAGJ35_05120, partial [Myxococcota bacterium]